MQNYLPNFEKFVIFNKVLLCVCLLKDSYRNNKKVQTDNLITFDKGVVCSVGAKYKNKIMEVFNNGNFTNSLDGFNK